jgi:hypothetical protein
MHPFGTMPRSVFALLTIFIVAPLMSAHAQASGLLGVDAGAPPAAMAEPSAEAGRAIVPAPVRAGAAIGISGAIRMIVVSIDEAMEPSVLAHFGGGWEHGHRWALHEESGGPRVLGEPARSADDGASPPPLQTPLLTDGIRAPSEPGIWHLESGTGPRLTVVTQVPANRSTAGRLNGYHIGTYPTAGSSRTDVYAPPTAFIQITPENRDLNVSEHLTLGQFLTKDQFDVWPKYLALDLRLVDKLELVVQELRAMGIRADRIHVMSGFRTPQYNGPGGNGRAALSRHMWGDAADVWIDSTGDGQMDDLNGDGRIDMDDAAVIMRAVDRVERRHPELIGGAGVYPTAPGRGPYIHIDARGYHSRW